MATVINQNDINFTVETGGKTHQGWGKKYTNANNILDGVYDPDPQNIEKSINAVEIDWNGAKLTENTTINTTGELLSFVLGMHQTQINQAGYIIGHQAEYQNISNKVNGLQSTIENLPASSGSQGPQGNQGTRGNQGAQGNQGTQGTQGAQGAQGEKGDTGSIDSSTLQSINSSIDTLQSFCGIHADQDLNNNYNYNESAITHIVSLQEQVADLQEQIYILSATVIALSETVNSSNS